MRTRLLLLIPLAGGIALRQSFCWGHPLQMLGTGIALVSAFALAGTFGDGTAAWAQRGHSPLRDRRCTE